MLSCYFCGVSLYLRCWDIRCCRCFFGCSGICMAELFAVADAFGDAVVSAWMRYLLLQMLFSCQLCINCIFNLLISRLVDAHFH